MRLSVLTPAILLMSCGAPTFSPEEIKISECFAASVVLKGIAAHAGAPASKTKSLSSLSSAYTQSFQATVARISTENGDLNGYSAMTKKNMDEVINDPLAWQERLHACV